MTPLDDVRGSAALRRSVASEARPDSAAVEAPQSRSSLDPPTSHNPCYVKFDVQGRRFCRDSPCVSAGFRDLGLTTGSPPPSARRNRRRSRGCGGRVARVTRRGIVTRAASAADRVVRTFGGITPVACTCSSARPEQPRRPRLWPSAALCEYTTGGAVSRRRRIASMAASSVASFTRCPVPWAWTRSTGRPSITRPSRCRSTGRPGRRRSGAWRRRPGRSGRRRPAECRPIAARLVGSALRAAPRRAASLM